MTPAIPLDEATCELSATRYTPLSHLASGSFGDVFIVRHQDLGTELVLKLLKPEFKTHADVVERLKVEARIQTHLAHPNLVRVTDFGWARSGQPFLVTERLVGETLQDRLKRELSIPLAESLDLATQMLEGLAVVHEAKLVHRYIKPANLFLARRPDGGATLKLLDFGIAKILDPEEGPSFGRHIKTAEGMVLGTPAYLAPEQILGRPVETKDPVGRMSTFGYDFLGRLVSAKYPLGRTLLIERDVGGHATFVKRPDGEELRLAYDPEGNVTEQVDARGRRSRMRYAGMGQLVEHVDPMGNRVRLRYDEELDLVGVENQAGDLYAFTLDRVGRVTQEKTFSGTKRSYVHDKAGRTLQVLSGAYRITKFERDPLGRIVKQTSQGGNPLVLAKPTEESFTYDELGSMVAARTPGADVVLERDAMGRIVREHETFKSKALRASISSRYDAAGLRVERTTSMAHRTDYAWNEAGELVGVGAGWDLDGLVAPLRNALPHAALGSFDIKIARDAIGQELARRLPGGVA